ncbi:MAG TPA: hypothetical protein VI299_23580 [Polyangiales bacterium]
MKPIGWIVVGAGMAAGGMVVARWLSTPSTAEPYAPSASEVPLTVDFEAAADKRVQPENYRKELSRIETELTQLSRLEERR